jgi:hypothetical protein
MYKDSFAWMGPAEFEPTFMTNDALHQENETWVITGYGKIPVITHLLHLLA